MSIFRGTGGSGNSTDDSIVSAVTEQAGIATTKAGEAATSASNANTSATNAATSATTASTKATEAASSATTASTKATEANTAKTGAEAAKTAAEAARDTALVHANTANNTHVQTVSGIATEVQNLDSIKTDITGVNTIKSDVTTVAGISSNVTTVAADASDIGTVATNITNVNNVGDNISNVNSVAGNATNINTVAGDASDIGTVSSNISNVNTVAGISSDVTTVAGLESKMDTVIADASDIGAVANNIDDVTTVAGINSEVDTVAGISAKVTTVADNITDVQNADTNAANASASASQAANSATAASASATTASTKATEASNSATAASNSASTASTKATEAAGSATTATTKATEASTSATNAATSATTATTKASEAASSATAASGSATTATTKASEADASANSAATSATDASNAASTWTNYYSTYLGAADAPPTVDVQGNALQTGAFYYDTGAGSNTVGLYVYNGSTWVYSTNYNNVTAPYSLAQDLATNSYDISFGDNAKATFGASDDLEIYHDGNNSYVTDTGTGGLYLRGSNEIALRSSSNENIFLGLTDGSAYVYHNGIVKLQTKSTGIDVTGTVTADGLIVDGTDSLRSSADDSLINISGGNATNSGANYALFGETHASLAGVHRWRTDGNERMRIDSSGNVGIGTTSPNGKLEVSSADFDTLYLTRSTAGSATILMKNSSNNGGLVQSLGNGGLSFFSTVSNSSSERMRIDASGNVGIGTTSPNSNLELSSATGSATISPTELRITSSTQASDWSTTDSWGVLAFHSKDTSGGGAGNLAEISANMENSVGGFASIDFTLQNPASSYAHTSWLKLRNSSSVETRQVVIEADGGLTVDNKVGIGTTSPDYPLEVSKAGTSGVGSVGLVPDSDNGHYIRYGGTGTNNDVFRLLGVGNLERMRIDTSGNLLVGTTSAVVANSSSNVGTAIGSGLIESARAGVVGQFNRHSSDGSIIDLQKNGTTIGSIGTTGGDMYVGTGDTGIRFDDATNHIRPCGVNGANLDATIDIGDSTRRFKDLYLSGGVKGNNLTFSGNGSSEHARIDYAGRVGIGTTSPAANLHVDASAPEFRLSQSGTAKVRLRTTGDNYINTGQNLGIGTTSPARKLTVQGGSGDNLPARIVGGSGTTKSHIEFQDASTTADYKVTLGSIGDSMSFQAGGSERMRIDASGNLLVGKTATASTTVGAEIRPEGRIFGTTNNQFTLLLNRTASDGDIAVFRRDGADVGSIGTTYQSGVRYMHIAGASTGIGFYSNGIFPCDSSGTFANNSKDLGSSTVKWDDVYATNGTIQTSDRNEKQDIAELSDAEQRVAVACKGLLRKFRWRYAVEEKGDEARIHFGIIAQDLQDAFTAEGLDAGDYAMFINSTWTDEETGEERSSMGVRYSELLAFIISAI